MSRALVDLCPLLLPQVCRIIAAGQQGHALDLRIIDTLRSPLEQEDNLARGVSWTKNSLHLPQKECPECKGLSHAVDLAPRELLSHKLWAPRSQLWERLGDLGEREGLEWGGNWPNHPDPAHLQLPPWYSPPDATEAPPGSSSNPVA